MRGPRAGEGRPSRWRAQLARKQGYGRQAPSLAARPSAYVSFCVLVILLSGEAAEQLGWQCKIGRHGQQQRLHIRFVCWTLLMIEATGA